MPGPIPEEDTLLSPSPPILSGGGWRGLGAFVSQLLAASPRAKMALAAVSPEQPPRRGHQKELRKQLGRATVQAETRDPV